MARYSSGPECDHCEYSNLLSGRSHYCGLDACYCRALRRMMRREVLDSFVPAGIGYGRANQRALRGDPDAVVVVNGFPHLVIKPGGAA